MRNNLGRYFYEVLLVDDQVPVIDKNVFKLLRDINAVFVVSYIIYGCKISFKKIN